MKNIPERINLVFFIVSMFLILMIKYEPFVWKGYADPYDYLHQSKESLSSKNLYFPEKAPEFHPRPFTVPLFYKMADSYPEKIVLLQKFIHTLVTFFLCYVVLLFLKNSLSKLLFIFLWYFLMSWWNILGWTQTLLSESLGISLMFFWFSSFLLFLKNRTITNIIIHVLATILFSFTRDSWPYVLILFYLSILTISILFERKYIANFIVFFVLSIFLFAVQQKSALSSQRYRIPITNNIVFRILPNDNYLSWFIDKGMPQANKLKAEYSNLKHWQKIYPLYNDPDYSALKDWILKDGKKVYTQFLISHPGFFFLLNEKPEHLKRIFAYNIGYTGTVKGYSVFSQRFFPLFNLVSILLLNGFLIFIYFKKNKTSSLLPTILILIFTFNALLFYAADALEVERHLITTNIIIQFLGIILTIFILDSDLVNKYINRILSFLQQKVGRPLPRSS